MKKTFLLFLFILLFFSHPQKLKCASTDKRRFPYEITSIQIENGVIHIKGWGMRVETHHYASADSHTYSLVFTSQHDQKVYTSLPVKFSQTDTMKVLNVRKCANNEYYQNGEVCFYDYDYVGFSFNIPLQDFSIDETYTARLYVYSKVLGLEDSTDVFYPTLIPIIEKKGKIEYKISSSLYDTQLTIADAAVFDRIAPQKQSVIRQASTICAYPYGYSRFFDKGSLYKRVYDRFSTESTIYYKVRTSAVTQCKNGRNIIFEGSDYDSWIAGNWVDYSGESLKIEVMDTNQPPIITVLEHPYLSMNETKNFDFKKYIQAIDPEDGIITAQTKQTNDVQFLTPGRYELFLEVCDQEGKKGYNTLVVTVVEENTPPVIYAEDIYLYQYDDFDPYEHAYASDKEDGDVTSTLICEGSIDTSQLGTTSLTYYAHDTKNAITSKVIQVHVIKNPKEKIRFISKQEHLLFYKEQIPLNWINSLDRLIEQITHPKVFAQHKFHL